MKRKGGERETEREKSGTERSSKKMATPQKDERLPK